MRRKGKEGCSHLEEVGVLKQLLGRRAVLGPLLQAAANKVPELLAELPCRGDGGGVLHNLGGGGGGGGETGSSQAKEDSGESSRVPSNPVPRANPPWNTLSVCLVVCVCVSPRRRCRHEDGQGGNPEVVLTCIMSCRGPTEAS